MMKPTLAKILLLAAALCLLPAALDGALPRASDSPCFVPSALAQEVGATAPQADKTEPTRKSLLDYYFDGGILMHPILLCSLVMTALIIELFVRLRAVKVAPPDVVQQLRSLFQSQNYQEAWRLCQAQRSFLTNVLAPALERLGRGREIVERVLMDHGVKEASALKTRVLYLSVVAVIAPMLGLLGTVQGMIMAFEVISLGGLGDPGKLAHSIGVALITTFAGLVVGIPSMFFYYFFRNQLAKITTIVEDTINELFEDVPYGELQGVKIGAALEEELKGVAAPVVTPQPAAPVRASVSTGATATAPAVVMENPKGASADMASCPKCQSLILAGSKVCPNCKAELDWV